MNVKVTIPSLRSVSIHFSHPPLSLSALQLIQTSSSHTDRKLKRLRESAAISLRAIELNERRRKRYETMTYDQHAERKIRAAVISISKQTSCQVDGRFRGHLVTTVSNVSDCLPRQARCLRADDRGCGSSSRSQPE